MDQTTADHIELYFRKYPEVPPEAIIKEDILRLGVKFTPAALARAQGFKLKTYFLFTYDHADNQGVRAPQDLYLSGGPYGLRHTIVRVVVSDRSPYCVDVQDDKLVITYQGQFLANIEYPRLAPYHYKTLPDGTRYGDYIPLVCDHLGFLTTYRTCQYWGKGLNCRFCDINENVRQIRKHFGKEAMPKAYKDIDSVVTVIEAMFAEQDPDLRVQEILITAGTILGELNGKNDTEFNLEYVEAIRDRIGYRIPIVLIIEAKKESELKRIKSAGVTSLNFNLEVWDKNIFAALCPGKQQYIGWDEWVRRLIKAVDVFGECNASPNFVAGVEMAQPYGFKEVDQAIKSTTEGFEFLMKHGVVPHLDTWTPEPGTMFEGHPPISLDYLIQVDRAWYETWKKYDYLPVTGYGPVGPGRAYYANTGSVDMGY
ncbi:MAG: radical SAM protein [Chloroflexi bacterium]|nr:radical SAM protein [Chloroflexota bacterium]